VPKVTQRVAASKGENILSLEVLSKPCGSGCSESHGS